MSLVQRALRPIVELREEESATALMMFGYSFLAMTAYNIVQPITRSRFITSLGSDNLPYILLVSAFIIGFIMQGYSKLGSLLPGRWIVPVTQGGMVGAAGRRSGSCSQTGQLWVDVALLPVRPDLRAFCSSASSGRWPTSFTTRGRRSGCSDSSAAARPLGGAAGASIAAFMRARDRHRATCVLVSADRARPVRAARRHDHPPRRAASSSTGSRRRAKRKGVGGAKRCGCCGSRSTCRSSRSTIAIDVDRRRAHRPAAEHGGRGAKGRGETDAITAVLGQVQVLRVGASGS